MSFFSAYARRPQAGPQVLFAKRPAGPIRLGAALLAGLVLSGCAGTKLDPSGGLSPRPGQAILIAKADERGFASNSGLVQVTDVDGQKRTTGRGTLGLTNRLALAAGPHTVSFTYSVSYGCQVIGCKTKVYNGKVRFMAQSERSYQLHAAITQDDKLWSWVIDETEGRVVAGRLPPGSQ